MSSACAARHFSRNQKGRVCSRSWCSARQVDDDEIIGCLDPANEGHYFLDGETCPNFRKTARRQFAIRSWVCLPGFQSAVAHFCLGKRRTANALRRRGHWLNAIAGRWRHWRRSAWRGREESSEQLSGGQQQRVAIARSLVNDRHLFSLTSHGKSGLRTSVEVMEIFQRLNRERGMTLILVTPRTDIADYADRVSVQGRQN